MWIKIFDLLENKVCDEILLCDKSIKISRVKYILCLSPCWIFYVWYFENTFECLIYSPYNTFAMSCDIVDLGKEKRTLYEFIYII